MTGDILERLAELERRMANIVLTGTIIEADYSIARVRVKAGEIETGWLPWITQRASKDSDWWAPEVGEQVLLLCPNGSPELGVVQPAIYQTAHPAPESNENVRKAVFEDGTAISYDRTAHLLTINVAGGVGAKFHLISEGDGEITSTGDLKLKGATITMEGPVTQTGGDMTSDGISAQGHTHAINSGSSAPGPTAGPN